MDKKHALSIPAGIGFILCLASQCSKRIVLISYLNDLENSGETDIRKRILKGCKNRLRPVLLTASTDILGFYSHALSNSAGAEVQRPIATVVIGGADHRIFSYPDRLASGLLCSKIEEGSGLSPRQKR